MGSRKRTIIPGSVDLLYLNYYFLTATNCMTHLNQSEQGLEWDKHVYSNENGAVNCFEKSKQTNKSNTSSTVDFRQSKKYTFTLYTCLNPENNGKTE